MTEPANAKEFLQQLRDKNGKQRQRFSDLTQYLAFKAREKGIPVGGQFELTPLCNFDCRMCYVHLLPEQMKDHHVLPAETWKDLMYQAWKAGMIEATLTGGECLAYPGFDELFLYLHSLGCEVVVLTNGYLLDDKRIRFFEEHRPVKIQVTLYGWNDDVYERVAGRRAFTTVSENLKKAVKAGLPVSVNVTPSVFLGEDVLETVRIAKEICGSVTVNSVLFTPREETGRSGQEANQGADIYLRIYQLLHQMNGEEIREIDDDLLPPAGGPSHECSECGLRCGGGRSSFVIDWKGTMTACNRMEMIRADVFPDGFDAAWKKVNHEAECWPRTPECEGCAYVHVCSNCAANQLKYAPPGKQPKQLCEQTRFFVKHGVRHIPECEKEG